MASQKMAESMCKNDRDFWNEVRKMNKSHKHIPAAIDGANNPEDILEIFKQKFHELYSSVPSPAEEMNLLMDRIKSIIQTKGADINPTFDIHKVISNLKSGKADGYLGMSSDCIINATHRLKVLLSLLFRAMTVHGFAPQKLLIGTMSPIPKTKGYTTASDKYRAITLISSLLKLYDYAIMNSQGYALVTDYLQFGFKEKSSTTLCTSRKSCSCSHVRCYQSI